MPLAGVIWIAYPPQSMVDERVLAERLIGYETSRPEVLVAAAGFVKGWLESRDIEVSERDHNGFPVLVAEVGAAATRRPASSCTATSTSSPGGPSSSSRGSRATA